MNETKHMEPRKLEAISLTQIQQKKLLQLHFETLLPTHTYYNRILHKPETDLKIE